MDDQVARHYERGNLREAITAGLQATVGDSRPVTIDDLAPADEFHIGGRPATVRLLDQLGLSADQHVLDIGAGIGGTARFMAHTYGCRVTGIELTPEFCDVAASLSALVGLSDRVTVRQGSALAMPFEDASFDAATMLHVGMNISDKPALFREAHRTLRPGSQLAIYDVLRGPAEGSLQFPVPWASEPSESFLASPDEMRGMLEQAGFTVERTADRTQTAIEFFEALTASGGGAPPPLGLHLIMGPNARAKLGNMIANVRNGLCGPWELIARRA